MKKTNIYYIGFLGFFFLLGLLLSDKIEISQDMTKAALNFTDWIKVNFFSIISILLGLMTLLITFKVIKNIFKS